MEQKKRLLIFIVAYAAEDTIAKVLGRIPSTLSAEYDVEVLIIDDASKDETFERAEAVRRSDTFPFKLHVLSNPVNQGYGGNQKIGFHYAAEQEFDFVALIHGDGQYAPECLPDLLKPLAAGDADAVFGSRMLTRLAALEGGMPLYKFVGNKILSGLQNWMLGTRLSEFHSGYRIYTVRALRQIPFDLNTNAFHFDTEIIIQLVFAGMRICELPIPTYYGNEICHVYGLKYAADVLATTLKAHIQGLGLLYDRKFDCRPLEQTNAHYTLKLGYESTHSLALETIPPRSRVLDLGCAGGQLGAELRKKGCYVTGVDVFPVANGVDLDAFIPHDLNAGVLPVDLQEFDYVLMLDVIEHLLSPEKFLDQLRVAAQFAPETRLIVSTANIGFILTRLGLLFGQFNYGKRGILDMTHSRLFTFATIRRLFEGAGFDTIAVRGVPAPFPRALGDRRLARCLLSLNAFLIRIARSLFSFQCFIVFKPRPSLPYLLRYARIESKKRTEAIDRSNSIASSARGVAPRG